MNKIGESAKEYCKNEHLKGSSFDDISMMKPAYIAGANAVLEEIEITLNADRILSHPFPTIEMRLWSIQDKIRELKGE